MDALTLQKIGREMSAQRNQIPLQNRLKFDAEAKEFYRALTDAADPEEVAILMEKWAYRLDCLHHPQSYRVPAYRIRRDDETAKAYLERIFAQERSLRNAQ